MTQATKAGDSISFSFSYGLHFINIINIIFIIIIIFPTLVAFHLLNEHIDVDICICILLLLNYYNYYHFFFSTTKLHEGKNLLNNKRVDVYCKLYSLGAYQLRRCICTLYLVKGVAFVFLCPTNAGDSISFEEGCRISPYTPKYI